LNAANIQLSIQTFACRGQNKKGAQDAQVPICVTRKAILHQYFAYPTHLKPLASQLDSRTSRDLYLISLFLTARTNIPREWQPIFSIKGVVLLY
jgi:hypothetical protein